MLTVGERTWFFLFSYYEAILFVEYEDSQEMPFGGCSSIDVKKIWSIGPQLDTLIAYRSSNLKYSRFVSILYIFLT